MSASATLTAPVITFAAGNVASLDLTQAGDRKFTILRAIDAAGRLEGVICTGLAWDADGDRPELADVAAECGLTMFDPADVTHTDFLARSPSEPARFFVLAVIEYEADGKTGYLARVRQVTDEPDGDFQRQFGWLPDTALRADL